MCESSPLPSIMYVTVVNAVHNEPKINTFLVVMRKVLCIM